MFGIKCKHCPNWQFCEWRDESDDTCWYEPDDLDDKDFATAIYEEIKRQNGDF